METRLHERAPQARCYRCGSTEVTRMCHHCGKPGCRAHIAATPMIAGRPLGREMRGLSMARKPAFHCAGCEHVAGPATLAVGLGGIAVTLLGIGVCWLSLAAGLILIAAGLAAAGASYWSARRRRPSGPPLPLPVLPRVDQLSLTEELHGRVTLAADGGYQVALDPVEGKLTAVLAFGKPDRERLEGYLRRYRPAAGSDVPFTAGSLVLTGPAGISLAGDFPGLVIPLRGQTAGYPVFDPDRPRAASTFRAEYLYQLTPDRAVSQVPVWITPAIAARSDWRALELQVHWDDLGERSDPRPLDQVESLSLRVPAGWGNVTGASPPVVVSPPGEADGGPPLRTIEWHKLRPDEDAGLGRRLELVVKFEEQIDRQDTITAHLDAAFRKSVSGISGVRFYGPLGSPRAGNPGPGIRTHVVLDAELSLEGTRYQDVRLVPDRTWPEDLTRSESTEFPGVIPSDETVIGLTNALADDGYYVKRVIENPPRSGTRANLVRRYWDIAGRRYEGVYPIDFHIILTGEEIHRGGIRAHSGTTKTRLTVQGSFANPGMRERVEQAWERLQALTVDTLRSPLYAGKPRTGPADPGEDWPPGEPNGPGPASGPAPGNGPGLVNGDGPRRAPRNSARLLELLGLLDDALLHGRITDERYWEMRERAEQQLGGG
jgi:hypothetical protein